MRRLPACRALSVTQKPNYLPAPANGEQRAQATSERPQGVKPASIFHGLLNNETLKQDLDCQPRESLKSNTGAGLNSDGSLPFDSVLVTPSRLLLG